MDRSMLVAWLILDGIGTVVGLVFVWLRDPAPPPTDEDYRGSKTSAASKPGNET